MNYKGLREANEEAKPLVDYARTLTTFLALFAVLGVSFAKFGCSPPSDRWTYILISVSFFMFLLFIIALWFVCLNLTQTLIFDLAFPAQQRTGWRWLLFIPVWLFSLVVITGAGSVVAYASSSAFNPDDWQCVFDKSYSDGTDLSQLQAPQTPATSSP